MTQDKPSLPSPPSTGLVAVIGLGCVLPDAPNVPRFWQNLTSGHNSIREVPHDRWDPALFWNPDPKVPDKTYAKIGAFVRDFPFDAKKFRIPPKVIASLDDSQLWALEAASQALADAGYDKKEFNRDRTAVILGNAMGGETRLPTSFRVAFPLFVKAIQSSPAYQGLDPARREQALRDAEVAFKKNLPEITEDTMPGELSNVVAGRIANVLNLTGKNFTTDAACASSLAAIDAAVKSLIEREVDLVLTGGADRSMDVATYVKFCKIGALSPDGSYPFDARANGFVMGEGAAFLLLKRLEDAERDGDKVYALIRGVGSSSDGKGKGITAPNPDGQRRCMARALQDAEIDAAELDAIECHGTSTKVGDVVEVQVLADIVGTKRPLQSIPIGSVKSNIGHLKAAAGAAGVIKSVLSLHEKQLPPSINYQTANPNLQIEKTAFYVNSRLSPFPVPAGGRPRRVGVSSFGFGGTNFHVVLEEYLPGKNIPRGRFSGSRRADGPEVVAQPAAANPVTNVLLQRSARPAEPLHPAATTDVLIVGAASTAQLPAAIANVKATMANEVTERTFHTFLHRQNSEAIQHHARAAVVVESFGDAAAKLDLALQAVQDPAKRTLLANKGVHVGEGRIPAKVAFLFPGQGSQYADMLRDLATRYEVVRQTLDEADEIMRPLIGGPLTEMMFTRPGHDRDAVEAQLKRTEITQPAVLAADTGLFRLLGQYGVRPHMVAGHSLGEYGALIGAGVLTFSDALLAVSARGREMANVHVPDLGKMASIGSDPATVETKLKAIQGYVIPANKNCKIQTVIAGASPAVDAAVAMFQKEGIQAQYIPVSAAFHSAIVAPAKEPLKKVLAGLDIRSPKIPVLSNVHAGYYPSGADVKAQIVDLLGQQVASAVEWERQTDRMYADGARLFVEVGPKSTLTTFTRNILESRLHAAVATNHPKKGGHYHFQDAIAMLAALGYPVRFPAPEDPTFSLPAFRDTLEPYADARANASQGVGAQGSAAAKTDHTGIASGAPAVARANAQPAHASAATPGRAELDAVVRQMAEMQRQITELAQGRAPSITPAPTPPSTVLTPAAGGELQRLRDRIAAFGFNVDPILITGVSVGTPGTFKKLFDDANFDLIFEGRNSIEPLSAAEQAGQVDKNVVRLVKSDTGDHRFELIQDVAEVIKLAAKKGEFDLVRDYGVKKDLDQALDITTRMAIAAGIEALKDAQIPLVRGYVRTSTGKYLPGEWALPEPLQHETGIIFASAFPGTTNLVENLSRYFGHKHAAAKVEELDAHYQQLISAMRDPANRNAIDAWYQSNRGQLQRAGQASRYEFDRRFLFQVLSMGHSQLAQLIRAKGPNTQVNAACASTTQAVTIAEDWIRTGRCKRVLVVGADDVTNADLLPFWTPGFLAAGAATTKGDVAEAALPFDRRRHGMIIGAGAVGIVIEAESCVRERGMEGITELLASVVANSAYHGTRLDTEHIATMMDQLVATAEKRTGLSRRDIAPRLMFMSHETYTPARGGSAMAEIEALTKTFGADVNKIVVANTKGFTGHPMGAGIEDAIAVRSVQTGRVPPIANLREPDPALGNIRLSEGGKYDLEYGLRLSAGFGSQISMYLMRLRSRDVKRIVDAPQYQRWLERVSGTRNPELEVANRTLRVKASLPPLQETAAPKQAVAAPAVAKPIAPMPTPAPKPVPVPAVVAAPPKLEVVLPQLIALVAEKTGYPKEMLEPDLDLEADLGIDTVKQAELFGVVREKYGIERDDTVQLKDYNTLGKIAGFVVSKSSAQPAVHVVPAAPTAATPAVVRAPTPAQVLAPKSTPAPAAARKSETEVLSRLTDLVVEKTGYPKDMLEPDLDLEADLGIDTVKQAELFGVIRTELGVERDDTVQLKDYNTLRKIAAFLASGQSKGAVTAMPTPVPAGAPTMPARAAMVTIAAPRPGPAAVPEGVRAPSGPLTHAAALTQIRKLMAEKTGYPEDMLEPDLDLEADLGIDTVKQAELFGLVRETFNLPRRDDLQIKDINTLSKIAQFAVDSSSGAAPAAPATVPVPAPVAPVPPPAPVAAPPPKPASAAVARAPATTTPSPGAVDEKTALARVRALVAEKTGYPEDLLEPDLDLEADLGIDTVKQAELFGIVRETYAIQRDDNLQLKDINTLAKIASFVAQRTATPQAAVAPAPPPAPMSTNGAHVEMAPPKVASAPFQPRATHRYVVRYAPVEGAEPYEHGLQGARLLIWAPLSLRPAIERELGRVGAEPHRLDHLPKNVDDAVAQLAASEADGLIFVPSAGTAGSRFQVEDTENIRALFRITKALASRQGVTLRWVATATFLGGHLGTATDLPVHPLDGALVGFAKAVAREIPSATVKSVDFDPDVDADTLARTLIAELTRHDGVVEVGTAGGRGTLRIVEQETVEEEPGVEIGPSDVIVVSGGGAGITAEILQRMAPRTRASFVLLGRTPLAAEAAKFAAYTDRDWNGERVVVQSRLKHEGKRVTPVAVEKELAPLRRAGEIHTAMEAMRRAGSRVEYHAVDVNDASAVATVLAGARTRLGAITGILHAAGIEESKLLVDKTEDSFRRVFDVKVLGARSLLEATLSDNLRFFVAFTSVAGRFGNAGQADYSAANDTLAKLCAVLRAERGAQFPATAIDWSAWADKGMATRGSIMTVLGEMGVTPIPLEEGIERFLAELEHGCRDPEVLVAAQLGRLAGDGVIAKPDEVRAVAVQRPKPAPARAPAPAPEPEPVPAASQQAVVLEEPPAPAAPAQAGLITAEISSDGRHATAPLVIDPSSDYYLKDHAVDGVPYLPGVFGFEAFSEVAAKLAPGLPLVGARDVEYRLPAKCLRDRPLELSIHASIANETDGQIEIGCRLQSVFTNAKGERMGTPRIHFTATLLFGGERPTRPEAPDMKGDLTRLVEADEIYQYFFHGPSFRVLDRVGLVVDGRTTIGLWSDPRAPLFKGRKATFVSNPMMRELAFQTAGAFELFHNGWLSLPKSEGRFKLYRVPTSETAVRAVATFQRIQDNVAHFDVVAATPEGEVLFEIRDFQLIRLRPLAPTNGASTGTAAVGAVQAEITSAPAPTQVYRNRWGNDVPLPLSDAVAVAVREADVVASGVTDADSLTSGERADQQRFRNDKRSREFFLGRLASKEAIAQLLGRPIREARGIEIRRLESGEPQPRGSGLDDVIVTITHTGDLAMAAAARRSSKIRTLGLDAERIEERAPAFEDEAFTRDERALIERVTSEGRDRVETIIRFWAVKEAVLKAIGKGFAVDVQHVRCTRLEEDERVVVELAPDAREALAQVGARSVHVQTWTRDGLAYALAWTEA